MRLKQVCDAIIDLLPQSENNLGFVSPTHFVLQMVSIVEELRRRGQNPTVVYNTNGYELPETIRSLEGIVNVWLPDFKYSDNYLAEALSQVPEYSRYALASLKEMMYQAGTTLHIDDRGIARCGIIIRHLVLPGFVDNSLGVLKVIAENLSSNLHISIMSQYYPPDNHVFTNFSRGKEKKFRDSQIANRKSLERPITRKEYESVVAEFHALGFIRGWLQEYESHGTYRPDFSKDIHFE